jgi:hypothetical protein
MTASLYDAAVECDAAVHCDEVVTAAPVPMLTVVRDDTPTFEKAPEKVSPRVERRTIVIRDPLVDGAAHLLSIGVRHVYAALWRVGVLEVSD